MSHLQSRVIVIGAGGYMGSFYIKKLLMIGIPHTHIVGVELDADRRRVASRANPKVTFVADLKSVADTTWDVAIIAVPAPYHAETIKACLDRDILNIFVEKPLVTSVSDLEMIADPGALIYTGYLINFSSAIRHLKKYVAANNLEYLSIAGYWGKNWAAVDRPIGPDLEEEFPHPFVAAYHVLKHSCPSLHIESKVILKTCIAHVRPELSDRAIESGFKGVSNDSAMGLFIAHCNERLVPVSIVSSFNMVTQTRRMDFVLQPKGGSFQTHKVQIDFDCVDGNGTYDEIKIVDARNNEILDREKHRADKLQEQLVAALCSFDDGPEDSRLVDQPTAAEFVKLFS